MTPDLELTSVPAWAVEPTCPAADLTGRHWTVLAVGIDAAAIAARWVDEIRTVHPDARPRVHEVADADAACAALDADSKMPWSGGGFCWPAPRTRVSASAPRLRSRRR